MALPPNSSWASYRTPDGPGKQPCIIVQNLVGLRMHACTNDRLADERATRGLEGRNGGETAIKNLDKHCKHRYHPSRPSQCKTSPSRAEMS